ncbi:MAG TPA: hypothetical protein VHO03_17180 [Ignavibacteriales bacterium]|nr:hypothetical protein [Ignavibacteriales bacterium]
MSSATDKTPMTAEEKRAAIALGRCRFLPASWNKRFAQDMSSLACTGGEITEKQRTCLWKVVYRYRRQISDPEILSIAKEKENGQASLPFKEDTPKQKARRMSGIKNKVTEFIEQELFNGFPEDNF